MKQQIFKEEIESEHRYQNLSFVYKAAIYCLKLVRSWKVKQSLLEAVRLHRKVSENP